MSSTEMIRDTPRVVATIVYESVFMFFLFPLISVYPASYEIYGYTTYLHAQYDSIICLMYHWMEEHLAFLRRKNHKMNPRPKTQGSWDYINAKIIWGDFINSKCNLIWFRHIMDLLRIGPFKQI